MEKVPKYIKDKCDRMEKLCSQAYSLKVEVENWCKANGIDTNSEEWEEDVRVETLGCDVILDVDEIERLLNENER